MTGIDLALVGARVRTLDPGRPRATAVGIAGGEIAAVGADAEIRGLAGPRTETIDLGGAAVVPGLTDSHIHPFHGAFDARGADLTNLWTLDGVRSALAAERRRCAQDEWVLGYGLDYDVFRETGIHGSLIEDAVQGSPAFLMFVDFHTAVATPRALALAGVDGPRTFDENAEIVCADGRPTGELREPAATALVAGAMPPLTAEQRYRLCVETLRRFASVGLTGLHAMDGTLATFDLLRELEENGDLISRAVTPFTITPESQPEDWDELVPHRDAGGRRWRAGVAKFFIDGVIDAGTGWLHEPDALGEGTLPFWPDPAHYRAAVARFAGAGFQCSTHATGDRGVREALDAYREAGAPQRGRHRIEHIETLQPVDLPRFAAEGVVASMQAQHMMWLDPDRDDNWSRRLGRERCRARARLPDPLATRVRRSRRARLRLARRALRSAARDRSCATAPASRRARPAPLRRRGAGRPRRARGLHDRRGCDDRRGAPAGPDRPRLRRRPLRLRRGSGRVRPRRSAGLPVLLTVVDGEIVHRAES